MKGPVAIVAFLVILVVGMLLTPCILAWFAAPSRPAADLSATEHLVHGVNLGNAGQYDRAMEELSRAIELDPACADCYYNRGVIYERREDFESARREFGRALALEPLHVDALCHRAAAHRKLGYYAEAIADLEACLAAIEDLPDADRAHVEELIQEIETEAGR